MPETPSDKATRRFWKYVNRAAPHECWEWTGPFDGDGRPRFQAAKKIFAAHRFAYELSFGPVPAGLMVNRSCGNRGCVNPDHLNASPRQQPKTHCPHGHAMSEENVYISPDGRRECRTCRRENAQAYHKALPRPRPSLPAAPLPAAPLPPVPTGCRSEFDGWPLALRSAWAALTHVEQAALIRARLSWRAMTPGQAAAPPPPRTGAALATAHRLLYAQEAAYRRGSYCAGASEVGV